MVSHHKHDPPSDEGRRTRRANATSFSGQVEPDQSIWKGRTRGSRQPGRQVLPKTAIKSQRKNQKVLHGPQAMKPRGPGRKVRKRKHMEDETHPVDPNMEKEADDPIPVQELPSEVHQSTISAKRRKNQGEAEKSRKTVASTDDEMKQLFEDFPGIEHRMNESSPMSDEAVLKTFKDFIRDHEPPHPRDVLPGSGKTKEKRRARKEEEGRRRAKQDLDNAKKWAPAIDQCSASSMETVKVQIGEGKRKRGEFHRAYQSSVSSVVDQNGEEEERRRKLAANGMVTQNSDFLDDYEPITREPVARCQMPVKNGEFISGVHQTPTSKKNRKEAKKPRTINASTDDEMNQLFKDYPEIERRLNECSPMSEETALETMMDFFRDHAPPHPRDVLPGSGRTKEKRRARKEERKRKLRVKNGSDNVEKWNQRFDQSSSVETEKAEDREVKRRRSELVTKGQYSNFLDDYEPIIREPVVRQTSFTSENHYHSDPKSQDIIPSQTLSPSTSAEVIDPNNETLLKCPRQYEEGTLRHEDHQPPYTSEIADPYDPRSQEMIPSASNATKAVVPDNEPLLKSLIQHGERPTNSPSTSSARPLPIHMEMRDEDIVDDTHTFIGLTDAYEAEMESNYTPPIHQKSMADSQTQTSFIRHDWFCTFHSTRESFLSACRKKKPTSPILLEDTLYSSFELQEYSNRAQNVGSYSQPDGFTLDSYAPEKINQAPEGVAQSLKSMKPPTDQSQMLLIGKEARSGAKAYPSVEMEPDSREPAEVVNMGQLPQGSEKVEEPESSVEFEILEADQKRTRLQPSIAPAEPVEPRKEGSPLAKSSERQYEVDEMPVASQSESASAFQKVPTSFNGQMPETSSDSPRKRAYLEPEPSKDLSTAQLVKKPGIGSLETTEPSREGNDQNLSPVMPQLSPQVSRKSVIQPAQNQVAHNTNSFSIQGILNNSAQEPNLHIGILNHQRLAPSVAQILMAFVQLAPNWLGTVTPEQWDNFRQKLKIRPAQNIPPGPIHQKISTLSMAAMPGPSIQNQFQVQPQNRMMSYFDIPQGPPYQMPRNIQGPAQQPLPPLPEQFLVHVQRCRQYGDHVQRLVGIEQMCTQEYIAHVRQRGPVAAVWTTNPGMARLLEGVKNYAKRNDDMEQELLRFLLHNTQFGYHPDIAPFIEAHRRNEGKPVPSGLNENLERNVLMKTLNYLSELQLKGFGLNVENTISLLLYSSAKFVAKNGFKMCGWWLIYSILEEHPIVLN